MYDDDFIFWEDYEGFDDIEIDFHTLWQEITNVTELVFKWLKTIDFTFTFHPGGQTTEITVSLWAVLVVFFLLDTLALCLMLANSSGSADDGNYNKRRKGK